MTAPKVFLVSGGVKTEYVPVESSPPASPPAAPQEPPRAFNSSAFFNSVRETLFGGSLNQGQVDGINILGAECKLWGLDPIIEQSAYVLGSAYWESAQTMQAIEEYGGPSMHYAPWYGRGLIQITWEENYMKQQTKLGEMQRVRDGGIPYQVHDDWNLALNLQTSAIITVGGMKDGDFTGVGLDDYIKPGSVDYINARRIVNGTDRAEQIAGYAEAFESAIRAGLET